MSRESEANARILEIYARTSTQAFDSEKEAMRAGARALRLTAELLDALQSLAHEAVWDEDSDRAAFDSAYAKAEIAIAKAGII